MGTEISHIDIHRKWGENEISFNLAAHEGGGGFSGSENNPESTASKIVRILKECKEIDPDETIEFASTRNSNTIRGTAERLTKEELTQILDELQKNEDILAMGIRFEIGGALTGK
jgi:hypothetical protein